MTISKFFTWSASFLSCAYVVWFVYERFTCISCWGNDIFFSIPFMAIVPASLEGFVLVKYLVVLANAVLIWSVVHGIGLLLSVAIKSSRNSKRNS